MIAVLVLFATGCASSNRLGEVSLDGESVAIAAAIPPHPRVQAGSPAEAAVDPGDPIGSAIRVSTSIEKRRQARRAQVRLDSVVSRIDVSDRIAREVLTNSARFLHFVASPTPEQAAYLIDLRIFEYGLIADSFEGATFFILRGEVIMTETATGRQLWRTRIQNREVLDSELFGLPPSVGNVVTGETLANLTEEEMEDGLVRLADLTAQHIVNTLREDYARTRDDYARRRR